MFEYRNLNFSGNYVKYVVFGKLQRKIAAVQSTSGCDIKMYVFNSNFKMMLHLDRKRIEVEEGKKSRKNANKSGKRD